MKAHEIVKQAFDELDSVQFVDNTVKEAEQAKADVRYIIYQLAVCLTQLAPDHLESADLQALSNTSIESTSQTLPKPTNGR